MIRRREIDSLEIKSRGGEGRNIRRMERLVMEKEDHCEGGKGRRLMAEIM
jgi:hypothetical protein